MEAWRRKWSILGDEEKLHTGGDTSRIVGTPSGVGLRMESSVDEVILGEDVGLSKDRGT